MVRSPFKRLLGIPTPAIFAGSIVIAALLLWQQDALDEIGPALRGADPWILIAGFLLYLVGLVLLCSRWHFLVKMVRGASDFLRAAEAFVTSVAVNYAAPLSLALPSRAYLTKRALGLGTAETATITIWEVWMDVAVLGVATVIWIAAGGWRGQGISLASSLLWIAIGFLILAFVTFLAAFRMSRRIRALVHSVRAHASVAVTHPLRRRGQATVSLGVTIVYWTLQGAVIWLLLWSIDGKHPETNLIVGLTSLPILVGMLSPVPGGAGIREALMIAVASVHGANEASVLLTGVTYRIALFAAIPVVYGGIRIGIGLQDRAHGRIAGGDSAAIE
jgi:uncharacterized protein (TIRG00374 family)